MAERFVQEALESDGSLFTPGAKIWTAENIEDLYERFVDNPDESSDRFEDKFRRQLEGAPLETRQLAAELLYIHLLFPANLVVTQAPDHPRSARRNLHHCASRTRQGARLRE